MVGMGVRCVMMVVTVTMTGYIKRTPLETFRQQNRGGRGRSGMATQDLRYLRKPYDEQALQSALSGLRRG